MPQYSTAPVVKNALISGIGARPALSGVQLSYGFLSKGLRTETIAVGRIEWEDEGWVPIGNRGKEENYTISLHIWVQRKGFTQKQSTERCFQILAEIELFLREQPTLGGLVALIGIEPVRVDEAPAREGYQTMAEAAIRVKARK